MKPCWPHCLSVLDLSLSPKYVRGCQSGEIEPISVHVSSSASLISQALYLSVLDPICPRVWAMMSHHVTILPVLIMPALASMVVISELTNLAIASVSSSSSYSSLSCVVRCCLYFCASLFKDSILPSVALFEGGQGGFVTLSPIITT
jgi:hypothetical protein